MIKFQKRSSLLQFILFSMTLQLYSMDKHHDAPHYECSLRSDGTLGNCHREFDGNSIRGNSSPSDVHCEKGYVGGPNSGNILVSVNGTVCTESEVLQATALWGEWTKGNKFSTNPQTTNILVGAQATLGGLIRILQLFDNNRGKYQGMGKFKMDCAMEYVQGKCTLENVTHYCHVNYKPDGEPRLHFESEQKRQEVIDLLKKMSAAGHIGPMQ